MNKKKLFTDYAFTLSKTVLSIGLPLFVLPFVINRIGPENYGIFSYVNSIISYFTLVSMLGTAGYGIRSVARIQDDEEEVKKLSSEIYFMQLISVTMILIIFFLGFYPFFTGEYKKVFLILSLLIFGKYLNTEWYFTAREEFKYIAKRSNIIKLLNVAAIILFIKQGDNCYKYALITALTQLANGAANTIRILPHISVKYMRLKSIRPHLKPTLLLFTFALTGIINSSIDKTLTGYLVGPLYVGYYAVGYRLTNVISQVFKALNSIIYPRVTALTAQNSESESRKLIQFNADFVFLLGLPIALGIALYGEWVLTLLFKETMLPAVNSLMILTLTIPAVSLLNIIRHHILIARDREKMLIIIWTFMILVNVVLNCLMVPQWKHTGAAAATLIANIAGLAFGMIYSYRNFGINFFDREQLKYLIATPVIILPYSLKYPFPEWAASHFGIVIQILISIPLYFIFVYLMKDKLVYKLIQKILKKRNQKR